MPEERVAINLDNKEPDNNDEYNSSSICNSESEDESSVYHIPVTKPKHSTAIRDKDVDEISKKFSGITIGVKPKGPIKSQSTFRQHEPGLLVLQHLNEGSNNNFNGGYLIDNSTSVPQDDYLDAIFNHPSLISALQNYTEEDREIITNTTPVLLNSENCFNPVPLQPTSSDQEFLEEYKDMAILAPTSLLDFNLTSPETSVSGNEGLSYGTPSPNYSTNSSTVDDFSRNIVQSQEEFVDSDRDVREFENVMSSWSEKTGNKIDVWIKVTVSDEKDLIVQLRKKLSQGNGDDNKILNIYAIIHRLMKPRIKKETIDTRSLLRDLYRNTNNLLWLVAQQKHTGLFNYFIETVQNLEINISEIQGQSIFLHQLAKCHQPEMVEMLAAALACKTRGPYNTPLFNINSTDYTGLTPLMTVLGKLSQHKIDSERYQVVKKALHAILKARTDLEESTCVQFAKDLKLPSEICHLLMSHCSSRWNILDEFGETLFDLTPYNV